MKIRSFNHLGYDTTVVDNTKNGRNVHFFSTDNNFNFLSFSLLSYGHNHSVMSHIGWEENKPPFIRMWKPFSSRCVLKP